jgi:hypothetical protein
MPVNLRVLVWALFGIIMRYVACVRHDGWNIVTKYHVPRSRVQSPPARHPFHITPSTRHFMNTSLTFCEEDVRLMFYILMRSFLYNLSGRIINKNSDTFRLVEPIVALHIKKFPDIYGTRRFITVLTRVRHLTLFWGKWLLFTLPHPISLI